MYDDRAPSGLLPMFISLGYCSLSIWSNVLNFCRRSRKTDPWDNLARPRWLFCYPYIFMSFMSFMSFMNVFLGEKIQRRLELYIFLCTKN